jgi:FkbM family methyltransferase
MKSDLEAIDAIVASPPATVVDIGAHHGDFSRYFAGLGYQVIAVEPFPYNIQCLRKALNAYPNMRIVEAALSKKTGQAEIYIGGPSTLCTLESKWVSDVFPEYFRTKSGKLSWKSITVRTLSWKDFVEQAALSAIELLKTDCEGHDAVILESMLSSGTSLPRILLYEGRGSGMPEGDKMLARLKEAGYTWLQHFYLDGVRDLCNHLLMRL